jgi:hypothetical protein
MVDKLKEVSPQTTLRSWVNPDFGIDATRRFGIDRKKSQTASGFDLKCFARDSLFCHSWLENAAKRFLFHLQKNGLESLVLVKTVCFTRGGNLPREKRFHMRKRSGVVKHAVHVFDVGDIPIANWLVERGSVFEHAMHVCDVRDIPLIDAPVKRTVKKTTETCR